MGVPAFSGVYILKDVLPPFGALVQLEVLLPRMEDPGVGVSLAGEGEVLRDEPNSSRRTETSGAGLIA